MRIKFLNNKAYLFSKWQPGITIMPCFVTVAISTGDNKINNAVMVKEKIIKEVWQNLLKFE